MPNRKPNPDERSDNAQKIREIIRNTEENLHEAEISMEFSDSTERQMIQEKNVRRKQSMESLKEEMKDELNK